MVVTLDGTIIIKDDNYMKKKKYELEEQVRNLDNQINDFYELSEWKGTYCNGKQIII